LPGGPEKNHKNLNHDSWALAEILIQDLRNINQECQLLNCNSGILKVFTFVRGEATHADKYTMAQYKVFDGEDNVYLTAHL
jgi:hypothetical protein